MYCILHYLINIVMEKVSGLISFSYLHVSVDQIKNYIYTVYLQMIILTAERGSINHTNEIICLEYLYFFISNIHSDESVIPTYIFCCQFQWKEKRFLSDVIGFLSFCDSFSVMY